MITLCTKNWNIGASRADCMDAYSGLCAGPGDPLDCASCLHCTARLNILIISHRRTLLCAALVRLLFAATATTTLRRLPRARLSFSFSADPPDPSVHGGSVCTRRASETGTLLRKEETFSQDKLVQRTLAHPLLPLPNHAHPNTSSSLWRHAITCHLRPPLPIPIAISFLFSRLVADASP